MRTGKSLFTTPLLCVFNKLMGRKSKEEKLIEKPERYRRLLEKLGFAQLMFDFYTAPVE
jgi:hypothetical protein